MSETELNSFEISDLVKVSLDGVWQLAEGGTNEGRLLAPWDDSMPAHIPGSIHTALIENQYIPDPYIGQNDSIAEKQSYKIWWLKRDFEFKRFLLMLDYLLEELQINVRLGSMVYS